MGAQSDTSDGPGLASGDNTAYSVLVSRYMQAIQHARGGIVLDNAEAALRTACPPHRRGHRQDVENRHHTPTATPSR